MKNSSCCFFGHSDAPESIRDRLRNTICELIENENIKEFYVGTHGRFDSMTFRVLSELKDKMPSIKITVVLAYMPHEESEFSTMSLLPDGIENVPKRFAINYRNKWMLDNSDFVVTYVTRTFGGAAKFAEMARKKNKNVINIA